MGAALQDEEEITAGHYWVLGGAPDAIFVSDQVMDSLFPDAEVDCIIANAKKGKEPEVTPSVERIVKGNSIIIASDIRSVEAADFKKSMMSLEVIGGGISLILILIGVVNYINVMITGVYTRKMELAVLESVGVTDVLAKSKGSSNPHNLVKATILALSEMRDARMVAQNRGVSMEKVFRG